MPAGAPEIGDASIIAGEDERIQQCVAFEPLDCQRPAIESDKIGPGPDPDRTRGAPDGLCAAKGCAFEQGAPGRVAGACQHRPRPVAEALRIFEQAKLLRQGDADIRIRTDPEPPAGFEKTRAVEYAIAEIGFGDRAEPGYGT